MDAKRSGGGLRRLASATALVAGLLLAGCYPGGPESASDVGTVVTVRSPGADFQGLTTYAMRDTVYEIKLEGQESEPLDRSLQLVILAELRAQMEAAGFVDVSNVAEANPDTVDVWLGAGAVQSDVWYYYSYGWGYWGGWCCYYPPYVGVGSFTQGSVVWQMVDVRDASEQDPPDAIWLSGLNGIVQSSNAANEGAVRNGIRQAFAQSPYIQAAPAGQ
jgi:hypothetical protein